MEKTYEKYLNEGFFDADVHSSDLEMVDGEDEKSSLSSLEKTNLKFLNLKVLSGDMQDFNKLKLIITKLENGQPLNPKYAALLLPILKVFIGKNISKLRMFLK